MKNIAQMMKQAQQMQQRMQDMQSELDQAEMTGASGGGLVKLVMSGKGDVKKVTIDPSLMVPEEAEVVEDLLLAAFNDAKAKVDRHSAEEMAKLTGGLQLPPGMKLPF